MIGVRTCGGIGNQLFQFAFAYAIAKRLDTSFFINRSPRSFKLPDYFELGNYNKFYNMVKRQLFKTRNYKRTECFVYENWKSPSENFLQLKDNAVYEGFFQSEEYFESSKDDIKKLFKIKNSHIRTFTSKYKTVFDKHKYIAIHMRRGDYLSYKNDVLGGKNISLPISYYQNCLERIVNRDNYLVIFVSDDINYVKEKFIAKDNYRFEVNSEIVDFQILLNADILILSNSTFSWWGAYLNPKATMVLAPKDWLGFKIGREYPSGISNKQWTWVDVPLETA